MIAFLAATLLYQSANAVDFPWAGGFNRDALKRLDVVSIVTALDTGRFQTRREMVSDGTGPVPKVLGNSTLVRLVTVKVQCGKDMKGGEILTLVEPTLPGLRNRLEFHVGDRYLVFGFRPVGDHLTFPSGRLASDSNAPLDTQLDSWNTERQSKSEISAVMAFPTSDLELSDGVEPDGLFLSVVRTLKPADDDSYRRVVSALRFCGPPITQKPWDQNQHVQVQYAKPDKLSEALISKLKPSSLFQRSQIWELLLRWLIPGSKVGYVLSIEQLANVPGVYAEGSGDSLYHDWDRCEHLEWFPVIKDSQWLDLVTQARNDVIAAFFLENYGPLLSRTDQRRLALRLLDPNPQIRLGVAYQLSLMNKDEKHRPFFVYTPQEAAPYIRYWIDYYGLKVD